MCKFFSFISRKDGKRFYSDWKLRQEMKFDRDCDSHSWLANKFKNDSGSPHNEDLVNKWEYDPLTQ